MFGNNTKPFYVDLFLVFLVVTWTDASVICSPRSLVHAFWILYFAGCTSQFFEGNVIKFGMVPNGHQIPRDRDWFVKRTGVTWVPDETAHYRDQSCASKLPRLCRLEKVFKYGAFKTEQLLVYSTCQSRQRTGCIKLSFVALFWVSLGHNYRWLQAWFPFHIRYGQCRAWNVND